MKYSIISLILFAMAINPAWSEEEKRDKLDYLNVFSDSSDVTAVFMSCAD